MEKDDEIKGSGNSYDFGARIYDPRLGRWLALDPLAAKYADWSPYAAFADNPIRYKDDDGREPIDPRTGNPFKINLNRAAVHDLYYIDRTKLKPVKDKDLFDNATPWIKRFRDTPDGAWDGASAARHETVWEHLSTDAGAGLERLFPGAGVGDMNSPNDKAWRDAAIQGTYTFVDDKYAESEVFFINTTEFNVISVEENYIKQIVNLSRSDGDSKYNINSVTTFDVQKGDVQSRNVGRGRVDKFRMLTVTETTETYKDNKATGEKTTKTYTKKEKVK